MALTESQRKKQIAAGRAEAARFRSEGSSRASSPTSSIDRSSSDESRRQAELHGITSGGVFAPGVNTAGLSAVLQEDERRQREEQQRRAEVVASASQPSSSILLDVQKERRQEQIRQETAARASVLQENILTKKQIEAQKRLEAAERLKDSSGVSSSGSPFDLESVPNFINPDYSVEGEKQSQFLRTGRGDRFNVPSKTQIAELGIQIPQELGTYSFTPTSKTETIQSSPRVSFPEDRSVLINDLKQARQAGAKTIEIQDPRTGKTKSVPIQSARHEILKIASQSAREGLDTGISYSWQGKETTSQTTSMVSSTPKQGDITFEQRIGAIIKSKTPLINSNPQDFIEGFVAPAENLGRSIAALPGYVSSYVTEGPIGASLYAKKEITDKTKPTGIDSLISGEPTGKSQAYNVGSVFGEAALFFTPTGFGKVASKGTQVAKTVREQKMLEKELESFVGPKVATEKTFSPVESTMGQKRVLEITPSKTKNVIPKIEQEPSKIFEVRPVKGRQGLYEVESTNPKATKYPFFQKTDKGFEPIVVSEAEQGTIPTKQILRGQQTPDDTLNQLAQKEFNLVQTGKEVQETVGRPNEALIRATGTSIIQPFARVTSFGPNALRDNPREFSRFLFGPESVKGLAIATKEARSKALTPISSVLVSDVRGYGTVGSRVGRKVREARRGDLLESFIGKIGKEPTSKRGGSILNRPEPVFKAFDEKQFKVGGEKFKKKNPLDTFVDDLMKSSKEVNPFADLTKLGKSKKRQTPISKGKFSLLDDPLQTGSKGKQITELTTKQAREEARRIVKDITKPTQKQKDVPYGFFPSAYGVQDQTQIVAFPESTPEKVRPRGKGELTTTFEDIISGKGYRVTPAGRSISDPFESMIGEQFRFRPEKSITSRLETNQRIGTGLTSITKQKTSITPITTLIQTPITTPGEKHTTRIIPRLTQPPTQTTTTYLINPPYNPPTTRPPRNPPRIFGFDVFVPFGYGGRGGGRSRRAKEYGIYSVDPERVGVIAAAGVPGYIGSSSPTVFGKGEKLLAKARKKKGATKSLLQDPFGGSSNKKGKKDPFSINFKI